MSAKGSCELGQAWCSPMSQDVGHHFGAAALWDALILCSYLTNSSAFSSLQIHLATLLLVTSKHMIFTSQDLNLLILYAGRYIWQMPLHELQSTLPKHKD